MLRSEHAASAAYSANSEEEILEQDNEIIRRVVELADRASEGFHATSFQPLGTFSALLREYSNIYRHNVDEGVSLNGEAGHHGLVAGQHHGEYLGEKWARLLSDLITRNRLFGAGFMMAAGWAPVHTDAYIVGDVLSELREVRDAIEGMADRVAWAEEVEARRAEIQAQHDAEVGDLRQALQQHIDERGAFRAQAEKQALANVAADIADLNRYLAELKEARALDIQTHRELAEAWSREKTEKTEMTDAFEAEIKALREKISTLEW